MNIFSWKISFELKEDKDSFSPTSINDIEELINWEKDGEPSAFVAFREDSGKKRIEFGYYNTSEKNWTTIHSPKIKLKQGKYIITCTRTGLSDKIFFTLSYEKEKISSWEFVFGDHNKPTNHYWGKSIGNKRTIAKNCRIFYLPFLGDQIL